MSNNANDTKNEDTANNNATTEQKPVDNNQIKVNNMLKDRLRKYIKKLDETGTSITKEESIKLEVDTFRQLYKPELAGNEDSYRDIPKFYFKLPRPDDLLAQKLREETRAQFLQKKSKELLDNSELKHLWSLLEKTNGSYNTANNDELIIDYFQFKKIRDEAGPKYKPYFTAEVFGRLQAAEGGVGRVRAVSLFNYVMRRVWLQQTRIGLSLYDVTGQGYLTEHDLESYIAELVPSLAALDGLDSSFSSFYVCTAARKFLFFLDPLRVGRVRIRDVLSCSFLDDLLELREEDLPMELQEQNWFSAASALRVYGQYLNLDRDHNGMLSINELAGYGSGTLTRAFLQRVFQQCLTYDGEMDYKTYLDLVLALENRRQPAALAYLFRVLDINCVGYLDAFTLNYFFKDLESYIAELVPSLAALDGLDSSFSSFYVCTAARKFLFFLDPLRVGRVRIRDVLSCSFLDDLLELREEDLPMELQEQNWFSAASALRVYGQYLNLDRDHNGMLSINELAGYGSGTLTRAFLQRVFQQCLTYDGEMDYKTYLDLVLALENRRQPAALAYLFRVLDINCVGYLDAFTLNYFFKAIQEQMIAHGAEPVNFDDVKDEIFDMIRPEDPSRITLQDLIRSGHGHTAVSILLELHGFWAYENREALAAAGDHA